MKTKIKEYLEYAIWVKVPMFVVVIAIVVSAILF